MSVEAPRDPRELARERRGNPNNNMSEDQNRNCRRRRCGSTGESGEAEEGSGSCKVERWGRNRCEANSRCERFGG